MLAFGSLKTGQVCKQATRRIRGIYGGKDHRDLLGEAYIIESTFEITMQQYRMILTSLDSRAQQSITLQLRQLCLSTDRHA